jgi:RecA/RadA recombinase
MDNPVISPNAPFAADPALRSQIHLVGGRKGGVGKTFLSRHLAEYLTIQQRQFSLIEADITIGDVGRVYGGFESGKTTAAVTIALSDDPKKYSEPDIIFQQAIEKRCVLVNLPAETNDALARWMESVDLMQLCQEQKINLYHWFVTDGCYASIRLLAESIENLKSELPHIVIRNEGRLNGMNFDYLAEEPLYQKILSSPNLVCLHDFPVLGSAEQFYLDKHNLTYEAGVEAARGEMGLIPAQRIKTFAERVYAVIDQVFAVDLPAFEAKHPPLPQTKSTRHRKPKISTQDAPTESNDSN